jgi:hypothetical protein
MRKTLLITTLVLVLALVLGACGGAGGGAADTAATAGEAAGEAAGDAAAAAGEAAGDAAAAGEDAAAAAGEAVDDAAAAAEDAAAAAADTGATEAMTETGAAETGATGAVTETGAADAGAAAGDMAAMMMGAFAAGTTNIEFGEGGAFTLGDDTTGTYAWEGNELVLSGGTLCPDQEGRYTVSGDMTAGITFTAVDDPCTARSDMLTGQGAFMMGAP